MRKALTLAAFAAAFGLTACGPAECKLDDPSTCGSGYVCEAVQDSDKAQCFRPVEVHGRVYDLETDAAIQGATVTALDTNGAPVGSIAVTDAEGNYVVQVPSTRTDEKGAFTSKQLTLRAAAADYVPFPSGLRTAIPFETSSAVQDGESNPFIVSSTVTAIGLRPLPEGERGLPSIRGNVALGTGVSSAMVVAENTGATVARSAITGRDGDYVLFNVPAGDYTVKAYAKGANFDPATTTVATENVVDVNLARNTVAPATVAGTITMVASTGVTSVILVVKSTFDPAIARGEAPAGLRAPEDPASPPNLGPGAFSISGVPDGEYAVLAGFENDGMVRDPDIQQGGTEIQFVTVTNGVPSALDAFKVTDAITMVGPGASGIETVNTATPTFQWQQYPQTATYTLRVVDELGNIIWTNTMGGPGSGTLSMPYAGPTLETGRIYQWRVTSTSNGGNTISMTEDLRGVFLVSL